MNRFQKIVAILRGAQETNKTEKELARDLADHTDDNQNFASLNYLKHVLYQTSKSRGWHSEEEINVGNFLCNLHGEVSELWEAWRAGKLNEPCDKADKMKALTGVGLTCAEEELADIIIRALDTSQTLGVDIAKAVYIKNEYNKTREHRHGGKLA